LGSPQKKDGDAVRGQMVSLAKNGPRKSVRMSVPISPIPMATRALGGPGADPGAKTVIERPQAAARPRAASQPAKPAPRNERRMLLIAGAAAVLLLVGGYFGWRAMSKPAPSQVAANVAAVPAGEPVRTDPAATPPPSGAVGSEAQPATKTPASTDNKSAAPAGDAPARIVVGNVPSNASIAVDGRRQSGTSLTVRPGTHEIRIEARGFEPMTQ